MEEEQSFAFAGAADDVRKTRPWTFLLMLLSSYIADRQLTAALSHMEALLATESASGDSAKEVNCFTH
eukprot:4529501-Amphidinium_carterae.1